MIPFLLTSAAASSRPAIECLLKRAVFSFSVSRITSKHALELLAGNKIIERFPGKGSFVARQEIAAK